MDQVETICGAAEDGLDEIFKKVTNPYEILCMCACIVAAYQTEDGKWVDKRAHSILGKMGALIDEVEARYREDILPDDPVQWDREI